MGLPMDDLHNPSVPSGPTTGQSASKDKDYDKLSLMDLISEKERVESELVALGSVLDSVCASDVLCFASVLTDFLQHGVNMNTSLTTFDGYPRDDLDIAQSA